jgi:GNAT superfamily N-acetyltransferase
VAYAARHGSLDLLGTTFFFRGGPYRATKHLLPRKSMTAIEIIDADLDRPDHQRAVLDLVDAYAQDPMGGGEPLRPEVRRDLVPGLRQHPTTQVLLAYRDGQPVGVAVCFLGFSTFYARPLLNIHDFAVLAPFRGQGIGTRMMAAVERKARALGCCKLTLEVFANNERALRAYRKHGFVQACYQEAAGAALFYAKNL